MEHNSTKSMVAAVGHAASESNKAKSSFDFVSHFKRVGLQTLTKEVLLLLLVPYSEENSRDLFEATRVSGAWRRAVAGLAGTVIGRRCLADKPKHLAQARLERLSNMKAALIALNGVLQAMDDLRETALAVGVTAGLKFVAGLLKYVTDAKKDKEAGLKETWTALGQLAGAVGRALPEGSAAQVVRGGEQWIIKLITKDSDADQPKDQSQNKSVDDFQKVAMELMEKASDDVVKKGKKASEAFKEFLGAFSKLTE